MQLLLLVAILWACREAWNTTHAAAGRARTRARSAATARGGHYNREAVKRRAARQATVGYWAREARHGFPDTRHGFRAGWSDHQHSVAEHDRDEATREADREHERAGWREQAAEHRRRLEEAARKRREREKDSTPGDGGGGRPDPPPLADGTTAGAPHPPPSSNGKGPPVTTPPGGGSGSGGDGTYDETLAICKRAVELCDQMAADMDLGAVKALADQLGAMVPEDKTTLGMAGEMATAAHDVETAIRELQERAQALHDRVEQTYGQVQEAKDASGEKLPEPEFVEH